MTESTFAGDPRPHPGGFTFSKGLARAFYPPESTKRRTERQTRFTTLRADRLSLGRDGDGPPARSWSGAPALTGGKSGDGSEMRSPQTSEQSRPSEVRQT